MSQFYIFVETIEYGINGRPTKRIRYDGKGIK